MVPRKKLNKYDFEQPQEMEHAVKANGKALSILMVGRAGTGKSTLINGFIGREKKRPSEGESSFNVESLVINGVPLTLMFWNSPKQQDAASSEIEQRIQEVDLVMYTIRMDDTRIRPQDRATLQMLSELFAHTLWSKTIFLLTFANKVEFLDQNQVPQRTKGYLTKKSQMWVRFIHECLSQGGLTEAELRDIPIVSVGHFSELKMFKNDEEDWTVLFMDSMFKRLGEDIWPSLLKICKICRH